MDVHCTTCGEPWDHFHLAEDAIHETGLDDSVIEAWQQLPAEEKLTPTYRAAFKAAGFEFGRTLMHVVRCPGCPQDASPDAEKLGLKHSIEDMLGDDLDGIAATFHDHSL